MPKKFDKDEHQWRRHGNPIIPDQNELGKAMRGEFEKIPNIDEDHPSGLLLPRDDLREDESEKDWLVNIGMTDGDINNEDQASEYRQHVTRLVTQFAKEQKVPFPVQVLLGLGTWENDMENSIVVRVFSVTRGEIEKFLDFLGQALKKEEAFAFKPDGSENHEIWPNPHHDPSGGNGLEGGTPARA